MDDCPLHVAHPGRALTAEGRGNLKNHSGEIVADDVLLNVDSHVAMRAVRGAHFGYTPTRLSVPHSVGEESPTLAAVTFDGLHQWTLEDDNFLFLMDIEGFFSVSVQVLLPESLSRASLIKFPAGEYVIFGYKVRAARSGARVAFVRGIAFDCVGCSVEPYKEVAGIEARSGPEVRRGCDRGISRDCLMLYQLLCDDSRSEGCFNLGLMYADGKAVPKDPSGAAMLFKRACDNWLPRDLDPPGNGAGSDGCFNLGLMYMNGEDLVVPRDPGQATLLLGKACQGSRAQPKGCTALGFIFDSGQGDSGRSVGEDLDLATGGYEAGCSGGDPIGCFNLGVMYEYGLGVTKDSARATAFYARSGLLGSGGQQRLIPQPVRLPVPIRMTPPTLGQLLFPFVENPHWASQGLRLVDIELEDLEHLPIVFLDDEAQREIRRAVAVLYDEDGTRYAYDNQARAMSVYTPQTYHNYGGSQHVHPDAVIQWVGGGWELVSACFSQERRYDVKVRTPKLADGKWAIPSGQPLLGIVRRSHGQGFLAGPDGLTEVPHYFKVYSASEGEIPRLQSSYPATKTEVRLTKYQGNAGQSGITSRSTYDGNWFATSCEEYSVNGILVNALERVAHGPNVKDPLLVFGAGQVAISGIAGEEIARKFPRGGTSLALASRPGRPQQTLYLVLADEEKRPMLTLMAEKDSKGQTITSVIEADGRSVRATSLGGPVVSRTASGGFEIRLGSPFNESVGQPTLRLPECVWPPWPVPLWRSITH